MTASASLRGRPEGFSSGAGPPTFLQRVRRVYSYRRIVKLLVARDLKVRYAGSALGYLWTVLDPLLMSVIYWVIFTQVFQRNVGYSPYILFLVAGQLIWAWFNGAVGATTRALRSEAQMVRSTNVPRELWILRVVCSKAIEYFLSLPVLALFALGYLKAPNWHIVLLPVAWLMMFVLLMGIGLILAPLSVLLRDVDRLVPIFLRMMFYLSPVLYSVDAVLAKAHALRYIYDVNPMVGPLMLSRATFFPQELKWDFVWHSSVVILLIFLLGVRVFTRTERQVLKEV